MIGKACNALFRPKHCVITARALKGKSLWTKLKHPKSIRHISMMSCGWAIIYASCYVEEHPFISVAAHTWAAIWMTVHAFGAAPFLMHGDKLWKLWAGGGAEDALPESTDKKVGE